MATESRIKRVKQEGLGAAYDLLGENIKHIFANKSLSDNADFTILFEYTLPTLTAEEPGDGDDLKGADLTDLQTDVTIGNGSIEATLPYMEGYTGYSENPEEQEGHYLALKATTTADYVYVTFVKGGEKKEVLAYNGDDLDGVVIERIANDNLEKIIIREVDKDLDEETTTEYVCDFTYQDKPEPEPDSEGGAE